MNLNKEIINLLKQEGCNIVGFADLLTIPEKQRKGFDFGIVMGATYTTEGLKEYLEGKSSKFGNDSGATFEALDRYKTTVMKFLKEKGYKASDKYSAMKLTHKTVATMAGLGWIGRCAILTTRELGPALRLEVVLTNARVQCGTPITKSQCPPDCTACVDICPANAIKGGLWELGVHRDEFFDVKACRKMYVSRGGLCGLCIAACPYTQKGFDYKRSDFNVKQFFIESIENEKALKKATKLTFLSHCKLVDLTDENRKKVLEISHPDSWAVAKYDLKKYKNKHITINFSVDVKRVGADGELRWQVNNSDYPAVSEINNAAVDTWYSMSGEWSGLIEDSYPVFYLNTWENNSEITTYYIDNFSIEITGD